MLVLGALVSASESYGYELVGTLQAAGLDGLTTGTLYPVLTRLEREGLVTSRLVASGAGPARKYYTPTTAGRAELARAHDAWSSLNHTVETLLGTDSKENA
jgi:PadR family transcriptional regulator PadR